MSLLIEERESVEGWEELLREFLSSTQGITDSVRLENLAKNLNDQLKNKELIVFCAFLNNAPQGFIAARPFGEVLQVTSFFIKLESYPENCGFRLVKALTDKAFSTDFKYYRHEQRLPFNMEPTFEEDLLKEGFMLYPRAEMLLEIMKDTDYPVNLPEGYSFLPFSTEQLEEILQVNVEANEGNPDQNIYPEGRNIDSLREAFSNITNNFQAIDKNLSPQIVSNGKIVGISFVGVRGEGRAYVLEVAVHPNYQRRGLGKALMNKILLECSLADVKEVLLGVTKENVAAYELYKKLGFKERHAILSIIKHK